MNLYLLYLATVFLVIVMPGPSTLLMIQHSASYGIKKSIYNALGSIAASSLLISAALAGLALLLTDFWLDMLSVLGAAFLVYIGLSSLKTVSDINSEEHQKSNKEIFKDSFFTGISNPKDIVFFLSLLPQFINQSIPYHQSAMMLAVSWIILDFSIMMGYANVANVMSKKLDNKAVDYARMASGVLIMVIGCSLFSNSIRHLL